MRKTVAIYVSMMCCLLEALMCTGCDVHEWPEPKEHASLCLRLDYETDMTEWHHQYIGSEVVEKGWGHTYDNALAHGRIRYVIRAFPVSGKQGILQEFTFEKDIAEGYGHEVMLDILPGEYSIVVWSDLVRTKEDARFYDASDFAEVMLQGRHQGNSNYRDAFYGKSICTLETSIKEHSYDTISITMKRPFAKFEVIANDLSAFIQSKRKEINEYKVKFQYIGFMPNAFSLFTNRPVDSTTGVIFDSFLKKLNDTEASMGFDYVFVGGNESAVTVRIGIYDNDGQPISMSDLIEVPLKSNYHTIITGNFFKQNASGGIDINPEYDGNHNIVLP